MKKLIIVLLLLAVISPVFAQDKKSDKKDDVYYVNVQVEKIVPTNTGYVIMYRGNSNALSIIGIPNEWFTDAASCAEMVRLADGGDWPSMSIFYINGEFSHVRLYIHRVRGHHTWGNVPHGTDVSKYFVDKNDFKVK